VEEAIVGELVKSAKNDNEAAREKLIALFRKDIRALSSSICNRPLNWENDDELSIGIIAFNEAIDYYDPDKNMKFWNYARIVIHRRLVDYFRKESRWTDRVAASLENDTTYLKYEAKESLDRYQEEKTQEELGIMVEMFQKRLGEFKVSFDSLIRNSPKHIDTKQNLVRMALLIKDNPSLLQKLIKKKRLPIKDIKKLTGQSRKVLESGRQYVIALVLILTVDEFGPLRNFIKFPDLEEGD